MVDTWFGDLINWFVEVQRMKGLEYQITIVSIIQHEIDFISLWMNLLWNINIIVSKVHIFWEGHKILRNLPLTFDGMYCSQKLGEDFAKFLWPSQNIWTLMFNKIFLAITNLLINQTFWQKTICKSIVTSNLLHAQNGS